MCSSGLVLGHSLRTALSSPVELGILFMNSADIFSEEKFSSQLRDNCNYTSSVGLLELQTDLTVEKFRMIFHELVIYFFVNRKTLCSAPLILPGWFCVISGQWESTTYFSAEKNFARGSRVTLIFRSSQVISPYHTNTLKTVVSSKPSLDITYLVLMFLAVPLLTNMENVLSTYLYQSVGEFCDCSLFIFLQSQTWKCHLCSLLCCSRGFITNPLD